MTHVDAESGTEGTELLERVLVLVTGSRNGKVTSDVLAEAGITVCVCGSVSDLCREIERGGAAALVTEELVTPETIAQLVGTLNRQPAWSDFPFVVFSAGGETPRGTGEWARVLGNVTFLDRPVRTRSMLAAVTAAIRSRRRQYEGRKAIESRDTFLAMLGHELRNPLGAICLALAALDRKADRAARPKEVAIIDRQARHLTRLVDDLLDVARVTHGKVTLECERVSVTDVVRGSYEAFEARAREHRLSYDLRGCTGDIWVDGDRQRLEQIFNNLLANAIKYTPPGGAVTVSVGVAHAAAVVSIADTGIGIAPEMLDGVFEVFTQAERSLDRVEGGLGLGLAVVRGLVRLHHGTVEATSEGLGRGSSFVVRLPLVQASATTPLGSNGRREGLPPARRVVVVEDSADIRDLLTELLQREGHDVVSASDGPRGLESILAVTPDVAFVDLGLPGFDGLELARRARALGSPTHLVAVTGYGQTLDRQRAFESGFDDHLTKPILGEDLDRAMLGLRSHRA